MVRFMGMLTGIMITISLYILYPGHNLQNMEPAAGVEATAVMPTESISTEQEQPVLHRIAEQSPESTPDHQLPATNPVKLEPAASPQSQEVVFWRPFHSRYSAAGFARRMTDATGVQIHVLPADKKQYRVAFNYLDENDRLSKISIIENITGLELEP